MSDGEDLPRDSLKGLKVLVIDDISDHKIFIGLVLKRYGAVSVEADSVAQAVSILDWFKPNIIISDISMPEQDGFDFIHILRHEIKDRITPVIALSAYSEKNWHVRSLVEGFQMHLAKPILRRNLISNVAYLAAQGRDQRMNPHFQ